MLDLNVNILTADSTCDYKDDMAMELEKLPRVEDSGSSNSSIVIAAEEAPSFAFHGGDEDSSINNNSALIFDILKRENEGLSTGIVTRPFFPVTEEKEGRRADFGAGLSSRPQWLNLSSADSGGGGQQPELRIVQQKQPQVKKSRRGPRSRSSQYRGVTFYRRTGRWESHIWDCGKQVYLGGFDTAHAAARAYDRAAIKFRGVDADINFHVSDYDEDMKQLRNLNKEEFVQVLRRQSTGFSRGSSKYRGVALHKCGQWEAKMGQFLGKKAYDKAAVQCNGREAITNFEHNVYQGEIVLDANREGSDHNLDLNLGISPPSGGPKGIPTRDSRFFWNASEIPNRMRSMVDGSATATAVGLNHHFLTVPSNHPPSYPHFFTKHEMRASDKRMEAAAISSPKWAWKMHGNSNLTTMPVFSIAASSGFSSSSSSATKMAAPPSSAADLPLNSQTNFAHNLCHPTMPGFNSHLQRG
ncbi:hypothetical protein UlMin_025790 [Ulmus minor]